MNNNLKDNGPIIGGGIAVVGGIIWILKKIFGRRDEPNPPTPIKPTISCNVAILGYKSAGKTTLWNGLQGKFEETRTTVISNKIEEFTMNGENHNIVIKKGFDIGGGIDFTNNLYKEIITKDTFIIYLINLTDFFVKEDREDVRVQINGQLSTIASLCRKTGNKHRPIIVGTCHDQYNEESEDSIKANLAKELKLMSAHDDVDYKNLFGEMPHEQIFVAEFKRPEDIEKIKNQIKEFGQRNYNLQKQ